MKKTKSKIRKIDSIINPPRWTDLDNKFRIFEGLIKDVVKNKKI